MTKLQIQMALAVSLCWASTVSLAQANPPTNADGGLRTGAGGVQCMEMMEVMAREEARKKSDITDLYLTWSQGLITGMRVADTVVNPEGQFPQFPEAPQLLIKLKEMCRRFPNLTLMGVSIIVYRRLSGPT